MVQEGINTKQEMFFKEISSEMRKEVMAPTTSLKEGFLNPNSILNQHKYLRSFFLMVLSTSENKRMVVVRVPER